MGELCNSARYGATPSSPTQMPYLSNWCSYLSVRLTACTALHGAAGAAHMGNTGMIPYAYVLSLQLDG